MSLRQRKSKKDSAPMPSTGAGLMRYFDEDLPGKKISPRSVIVINSIFVILVIIANSDIFNF